MRYELCIPAILILLSMRVSAEEPSDYRIDAVPNGYNLYAYDDCGVVGRQPHVDLADCYNFTFALSDTDADLKSRTAVFSYKEIRINYADLDPKLSYALAMTYASDHVYKRVQSLWAGGVQLHGPIALPNAKAIRVIVKVPESAVNDGKLALTIKIHGEVNATASIIELWASGPPKKTLRLTSVAGTIGGLTGRVVDMKNEGVKGAQVRLTAAGKTQALATTVTSDDGSFGFDERLWKGNKSNMRVEASSGGEQVSVTVPASELGFEPVRYRPIPTKIEGLETHEISLNGTWRIDPTPAEGFRDGPLAAKQWADFHVPGQWVQQGFDVHQDKPVAVAREFTIPKEWAGYRVFLRFDAIHAGTNYWLNGKKLGYSENLFTPVEWEITDAARPGKVNRLDLEMKVATDSERLSYSSGYAFHSLGGIDRSVRLYALPMINISAMHVSTDLDKQYRDAELRLQLVMDLPKDGSFEDLPLELVIGLMGPDGMPVEHSKRLMELKNLHPGANVIDMITRVPNPRKWSAEKPNLYKLALVLQCAEETIERVERSIGFRKIEIRGSLVYINGRIVKFAGACHHEFDALTGRADTMHHGEQDVKMLKNANLNYLRTSHYPPTQELLDAADRLGVYVECEAPFCWVAPTEDLSDLRAVLTPTSAMIDYCHTHPSIIVWSLANESSFNKTFAISNKLVKQLDPTRLTTFNNPDPERICDIDNGHYPPMPFDDVAKDDPRPLFLGEYWFPVCHEQTDVNIDPGLRELWGHGHADPDSDFGKACAAGMDSPCMLAGERPGAWSHIYHSNRVIGGAIWAEIDEPFYFKNGTHVGYAWHHGFWGLLDAWRRPKPEWWLAKLIFSPVWFPARQVAFTPGQGSVSVPVENRYSFTDLKELSFSWEIGSKSGKIKASLAPGASGEIALPIPTGTVEGDKVTLRVTDAHGELINVLKIALGKTKQAPLPQPKGAPRWREDGNTVVIEYNGLSLALDRKSGTFDTANPSHKAPILSFPIFHLTRHDYGDLNGPKSPPYEVLPDAKTRAIESVTTVEQPNGLEITVKDHYDHFAGYVSWLIDKDGVGRISYDYTYTGDNLDAREIGISALLQRQYDEVKWNRWSEWDIFPSDSISRTQGTAKARRPANQPDVAENVPPTWPWSLDQTELGTNDFRSIKFNIYEASLVAPDGSRVCVNANADAHFRACLTQDGVKMHILKHCPLGRVLLKNGDRLTGEFTVTMLGSTKR